MSVLNLPPGVERRLWPDPPQTVQVRYYSHIAGKMITETKKAQVTAFNGGILIKFHEPLPGLLDAEREEIWGRIQAEIGTNKAEAERWKRINSEVSKGFQHTVKVLRRMLGLRKRVG